MENARIECERAIDPSYLEDPPPLNDEQLHSMYENDLAQAACLEERGYPHIDVPSFERYSTDLKAPSTQFHRSSNKAYSPPTSTSRNAVIETSPPGSRPHEHQETNPPLLQHTRYKTSGVLTDRR